MFHSTPRLLKDEKKPDLDEGHHQGGGLLAMAEAKMRSYIKSGAMDNLEGKGKPTEFE